MNKRPVFTTHNERLRMYMAFPNPSRIKSFTKDQFNDGEPIDHNSDVYEFVFRREFENCGKQIDGDIISYWQRRERKKQRLRFKQGLE